MDTIPKVHSGSRLNLARTFFSTGLHCAMDKTIECRMITRRWTFGSWQMEAKAKWLCWDIWRSGQLAVRTFDS